MKLIKVKCKDAAAIGHWWEGSRGSHFDIDKHEAENLGKDFINSQYFQRLKSKVEEIGRKNTFGDAGFLVPRILKLMSFENKGTLGIYKQFLKKVFKDVHVDGHTPVPERMADDVLDGGFVVDLLWPAKSKLLEDFVGTDWRKYRRGAI